MAEAEESDGETYEFLLTVIPLSANYLISGVNQMFVKSR